MLNQLTISALSTPIYSNKNVDEYITEELKLVNDTVFVASKEEDWHLVPDNDGKLHLVDINNVEMEMEPSFVALNDMIFRLWTRANPNQPQIIQIYNNAQLDASNFNPALQTRFHAHGWGTGGPTMGTNIRIPLLNRIDCNMFIADWGVGSNTINYITARNRVNEVGAVVAQYIDWINLRGVPFSAITIFGSSLGAHVAGAAGKRTSRGRVHAIIGLDPAGPLFSIDNPSERLHHTGNKVELLFTCLSEILTLNYLTYRR